VEAAGLDRTFQTTVNFHFTNYGIVDDIIQ
jgi:hypothetical protein